MALDLLLPGILVVLADQLAKIFVITRAAEWQRQLGRSGIKIRRVTNARGIQSFFEPPTLLVAWALVLASIVFVLRQGYFFQPRAAQFGLGAALGGAASNVYDRVKGRPVIDFVDVGWWPVFNVADVGIALGVMVALWFIR